MDKKDKIAGGLYGLLIGDALGVPYEFSNALDLPTIEELEYTPPENYKRSHSNVLPGTWSDDGAQALCLLDSLIQCSKFDLFDFAGRLLKWYEDGLWAVNEVVFDVGMQTSFSLLAFRNGISPEKSGFCKPEGKGNGALMRVLPLALWHMGTAEQLVIDAHRQCLVTHGHICNQVCCALYCLTAKELLNGASFQAGYSTAVRELRQIYQDKPDYLQELEFSIRPDEPFFGTGTGYVVDCLHSALMIIEQTDSYESAVKRSIALGNDTDTTACVAGGLAGIIYGWANIPSRWKKDLREAGRVDALVKPILI